MQNDGSENDAERHQDPVCTSHQMKSERKIKTMTMMCFAKNRVSVPIQPNRRNRVKYSFDEWCTDLLQFKKEVGHCHMPCKFSGHPLLEYCCRSTKVAYKQIQKGKKSKINLSEDMIERLESGFHWQATNYDEGFEKRWHELIRFKEEFGPQRYPTNQPLGRQCKNMQIKCKQKQNCLKTNTNLAQYRIERLEKIDSIGSSSTIRYSRTLQRANNF